MAARTSSTSWPERCIIAIDIDCFYVACERLLNPALIGKPVGIQQKYILATCSYEARAFGVGKLQRWKDALKLCPEMILVDGEDLTFYRRFSRGITRLVKSIIWNRRVERLGMDELFCDVTDMVRSHVAQISQPSTSAAPYANGGKVFFNLSPPQTSAITDEARNGFWYDPSVAPSLEVPGNLSSNAETSALLAAAAHLAAHIRSRIHAELGFTTSAGIAHNKIIAKLVGNLNKPALQTMWNPDARRYKQDQAEFLADFEANKVQGIGHAMLNAIRTIVDERLGPDEDRRLTCSLLRTTLTEQDLVKIFDTKLGLKTWHLLWGEDDEPVNPSPEYPVQISCEDSHVGITSFKQAVETMRGLALHLLKRLREDLTEAVDLIPLAAPDGNLVISRNDIQDAETHATWAQYPTSLRLTVRQGYDKRRESTSVPFPIDSIDEGLAVELRATKLVNGVLAAMMKRLLRMTSIDLQCRLTIINICATNFTATRPSRTIQSMFGKRAQISDDKCATPTSIDLTNVLSDPIDESFDFSSTIISIEDDSADDAQPVIIESLGTSPTPATITNLATDSAEDDGIVFVQEIRPDYVTCSDCGSRVFSFALPAHAAFHRNSNGTAKRVLPAEALKPSRKQLQKRRRRDT